MQFNFTLNKNKLAKMLAKRDQTYHYSLSLHWFWGFLESEGNFGGGKKTAVLQCSQHSSDFFLICAIKGWVGGGRVSATKRLDGRTCVTYTLRGKELQSKMDSLFRGAPLTPKMERDFIPWVRRYFPEIAEGLIKSLNVSPQLPVDWLVGFVDGDGSFYTTVRQQKDYVIGFQFQAVLDVSQKINVPGQNTLLRRISDQFFFDSPTKTLTKTPDKDGMYRIRLVNAHYLQQRCIPLFKGRLQSRREIQLNLFQEGVALIVSGGHLRVENKRKIQSYITRCQEWRNKHSAACWRAFQEQLLRQRKKKKKKSRSKYIDLARFAR